MIISILLILLGIVVAAIGTPHSVWWFIKG